MPKQYYVYILTNKRNGTLYTGVTGALVKRTFDHKEKQSTFTAKHNLRYLVWYEPHDTPTAAIAREKQIKKWKREWKVNLIEGFNPAWNDLFEQIAG
jgi:putative endonuclease